MRNFNSFAVRLDGECRTNCECDDRLANRHLQMNRAALSDRSAEIRASRVMKVAVSNVFRDSGTSRRTWGAARPCRKPLWLHGYLARQGDMA